jgi:hypothetical protein
LHTKAGNDLPVSEFGSDFWPGTTNPCGSQGLAQGSYAAFSALTIHTERECELSTL